MPKGVRSTVKDSGLLQAALEGLEAQKQRIEEHIRQVQAMLGRRRGRPPASAKAAPEKPAGKRKLSAAARKRIAAAQKRRWAEFRKKAAAAAKA
ncbi:MAG: hypothetical protein ABSE56_09140 [Bryobacteraceae bacterium]|jgi:hypothetical protein